MRIELENTLVILLVHLTRMSILLMRKKVGARGCNWRNPRLRVWKGFLQMVTHSCYRMSD